MSKFGTNNDASQWEEDEEEEEGEDEEKEALLTS